MRRWRLLSLFRKQRIDEQLDDELRFHLEALAADYERRGMAPAEARRAARHKLGGLDEIREACRDQRSLPLVETLAADVRFGWRSLAARPGFTAVALLSLALGIGANSAMFSVVYAALLRPLPYFQPDRLLCVTTYFPAFRSSVVLAPDYLEWRDRNSSFDQMAAYTIADHSFQGAEFPETASVAKVTREFFSTLGVSPALGRPLGGAPAIVLNHAFWMRHYGGDRNIIGRSLRLDGNSYEVTGVMREGFQFPPNVDAWIPFPMDAAQYVPGRPIEFVRVIGRLRPGITLPQARADIQRMLSPAAGRVRPPGAQARLLPLHEYLTGNTRTALFLLAGAVGFVLLITCANMANLLVARGLERQRELAIRAALGAGARRLARQFVTESLLLALAGGTLGALIAIWAMRALAPLVPPSMARPEASFVFGSSLLIALLAGLAFGSAPAALAARADVNGILKRSSRGAVHGEGGRWRMALTISQVALSLALLIGAGLTIRSLYRTLSVDPGFRSDEAVSFVLRLHANQYEGGCGSAFFTRVLEALRVIPGVEDVGIASRFPFSATGANTELVSREGEPPWPSEEGALHVVESALASSSFFRALRIPVLAGRLPRDEEKDVAIINESFQRRFFPAGQAVGKRFKSGIPEASVPWITVAGVVADVRSDGLEEPVKPMSYRPYRDRNIRFAGVAVRSRLGLAQLGPAIRRAVASADKAVPVDDLRAMEDRLDQSVAPQRLRTTLLGLFGGLALALAFAGIYGVMAYAVSQRESEFGLRLALGATPEQLRWSVVRQAMRLAAMGAALGVALAIPGARYLGTLLYRTGPFDGAVYVCVAALLAGTTLAASYLPASRASRADPLEALRRE